MTGWTREINRIGQIYHENQGFRIYGEKENGEHEREFTLYKMTTDSAGKVIGRFPTVEAAKAVAKMNFMNQEL